MKIHIQGFLRNPTHSWSIVLRSLALAFVALGHDVALTPTDESSEPLPDALSRLITARPSPSDVSLSYTAPHNWPAYLAPGKRRLAIWAYEYDQAPGAPSRIQPAFGKFAQAVEYILPPSNFAAQVFRSMGFPPSKLVVIPHGAYPSDAPTNDENRILINIAQNHRRKNLPAALTAFGKAFHRDDPVTLVLKLSPHNNANHSFNVNPQEILKTFKQQFPKHANIEVINSYLPEVGPLYRACKVNFTATHAEAF